MDPDWVVMGFEYEDNCVTKEDLEDIKRQAEAAPKSHGLKYFYMSNHYWNLYCDQRAGYHWFYLSGKDVQYCTCGLKVPKDSEVETSLGHRNLPSFEGITTIFINSWWWQPSKEVYEYGAHCQSCAKGSLRNLSKEEVHLWMENHKEDCPESDKLKGLS